MVEQKE